LKLIDLLYQQMERFSTSLKDKELSQMSTISLEVILLQEKMFSVPLEDEYMGTITVAI